MTKDSGRVTGSREPSPSSTGLGPPGFDPAREGLCEICGRDYRTWAAASPLWNAVVRGGSINGDEEFAFLCADCFMGLADDRGIAAVFQLRAERSIPLETVTPSGRVWNDAEFRFK